MASNTPVLQVENLQFSWKAGSPPILDIGEFTVEAKERVFLQGPSGCGKTTLLGLIGGVLNASAGELSVLGTSLNQIKGKKRDAFRVAHIGFIFQMFNLLPYLSVVENVCLPCQFSKERKKRALENSGSLKAEAIRLLADLGLEGDHLLSRSVHAFSVGQQQRVAAARALMGSPELVIADEPTSALDADARGAFLELLFKECESFGSSLIFVSHDSGLAHFFDRHVSMTDLNQVGKS